MVKSAQEYEDIRRKTIEENKKRMVELNIKKLSESFKPSTPTKSHKPSSVKRLRGRSADVPIGPVRRSGRNVDKPAVSYKEYALDAVLGGRRVYNYKRRDLSNRVYASDGDRLDAIDRAEQLEASLDSKLPACVKPMLQSHVTGGFWLSLPLDFCKGRLPDEDDFIILVDEEGNESEVKYLVGKNGLSGGWRGFAIDHELVDGDCLVFQLIKPKTLKVYILRVNAPDEYEEVQEEDLDQSGEGQTQVEETKSTQKTKEDLDQSREGQKAQAKGKKGSKKTKRG